MIKALAFGLALTAALPAFATTVVKISGGDPTLTFTIPDQPTAANTLDGVQLGYQNVAAMLDGTAVTIPYIVFNPEVYGGGITTAPVDYHPYAFDTPQLYSGQESNPKFGSSSYDLTNDETGQEDRLTISAAPEPATWAVMLLGVGLVGARLRRRSRAVCA